MARQFILGISLILVVLFGGCAASDPILATIGDEKITLHSFEDNFAKSNGSWDSSAVASFEDRQKFLDLLIKFKLKVKEAYAQRLESDSVVVSEMDSYHTSIAQSYMLDKEVVEPGVKKLYNRKKEELRVSHILFRIQGNGTPEDTLKTYNLAMSVIDQIPQIPFDSLAYRYSEDPSAKANYGDLGFFSTGRMVHEFENACYTLKPGEYTKRPIRTQFGYHIIKMTVRRPNSGSIRLSHILLRFNGPSKDTTVVSDTAAVRDTAWMLYKQLKNGASFKELARKYSKDPKTVSKDGDLGFFERVQIVPVIANILFNLKIDSVSEPIGFNYGYHIFQLTEKKPFPSFEETEKDLKTQYQQTYYQEDYKKYVSMLRTKYQVIADSTAVKLLISKLDTTKTVGYANWQDTLMTGILKETLIKSTNRQFKVKDFIEKITSTNENNDFSLSPPGVWVLVKKIVDVVALEQQARQIANKYPVLVQLVKESKEATLKERIEQDEVRKKIVVNDTLLRKYFDEHMDEYRWPERVNFAEIHTSTDSIAKAAYDKIKKGKDFLNTAKEYTNRSGYREKKGVWGFQVFAFNDLSLKASKMAIDSITAPFKFEGGWSIIKALGRDSMKAKTFEEAIQEVTTAYQEEASIQREQEWVEILKKKYPVTINKEVLANAFKEKRAKAR